MVHAMLQRGSVTGDRTHLGRKHRSEAPRSTRNLAPAAGQIPPTARVRGIRADEREGARKVSTMSNAARNGRQAFRIIVTLVAVFLGVTLVPARASADEDLLLRHGRRGPIVAPPTPSPRLTLPTGGPGDIIPIPR